MDFFFLYFFYYFLFLFFKSCNAIRKDLGLLTHEKQLRQQNEQKEVEEK